MGLYIYSSFLLINIFNILTLSISIDNDIEEDVIKLGILFRHSAREPIIYKVNEETAQLTNEGKLQAFNRGQWLRKRYPNALQKKYDPKEIYSRSTNVDRCLMSSQGLLAGLYYPLDPSDHWSSLEWTPIPVHTVFKEDDEVLYQERQIFCPKMKKLFDEKVDFLRGKYPDIIDYYHQKEGLEFVQQAEIYHIVTTLINKTDILHLNNSYIDEFTNDCTRLFSEPEWIKFESGPKFGELLRKWEDNYNVVLFGAHDISIWNYIFALGFDQPKSIGFISTIIFEIHERKNNSSSSQLVRVIFKNGPDAENQVKILQECKSEFCPYDDFINILKSKIFDNWKKNCELE